MKNTDWIGAYILLGFAALMVFLHRRYEPVAIASDDGKPDDFDPSIYREENRASKLPCPPDCADNDAGLIARVKMHLPCPYDCGDTMNVAGSGSTLQIAKPGVIAHTPTVR